MWIYKLNTLKSNFISPECVISKCNIDNSSKSILSEFDDKIRIKIADASIKIIDEEISRLEGEFKEL